MLTLYDHGKKQGKVGVWTRWLFRDLWICVLTSFILSPRALSACLGLVTAQV